MFELLSIVCAAAALTQGGCVPDAGGAPAERRSMPDAYEMQVGPGAFQLSYAASAREYDVGTLTEHWRRRAGQLCAGDYSGMPMSQTQYPEAGFDSMTSFLTVSAVRSFNVEVYGVAHCADPGR